MTHTRTTLSTIAGLAAVVLLLAGCGTSGPPADDSPDAEPVIEGTVDLSYWGSATRTEKYNEINALFEAANDGVTVQASSTDFVSYFDQLNVQAASRNMPCVTTLQTRQLNDYTTNGTLTDLQPLIDAGQIDVGDIPDNLLDTGRGPDGKLYMIPFGVAWNATAVNSAMAEEYDIELLPEGYTWDDYEEWLDDASSKLPDGIAATDDQGQDPPVFSAWVISQGEQMFSDEGQIGFPKSVLEDYWDMWQDYADAGYTSSAQQNAEEAAQLEQFDVTLGKSLSGAIAGNALPAIQAANPAANMVSMAFPSGESGLGNMFFVSGYSIPVTCDNIDTAAAYIDFWSNDDEASTVFASDNGAVANARQLEDQIANPVSPGVQYVLEQYQYILEQNVPAQTMPPGYNAVFEAAFKRTYQDIAFDRKTVKEAVDAFFIEANNSLGSQ